MQQAVDSYFEERAELDERPTLTGLALHLGFSSLGSFKRYEGYTDQDFKWIIDTARMRVMERVEARGKTAFDVFHLKNLDPDNWKDKTERDINDQRALEKPDQQALISQLKSRLQERQLNAIPGEAVRVDPEDEEWM